MPLWGKPEAFHSRGPGSASKPTMIERYADLWLVLQSFDIGIRKDHSSMDTLYILAGELQRARARIAELELESDLV